MELKRFLEDRTDIKVVLSETGGIQFMGIEEAAALVQATTVRTSDLVSQLEREQSKLIEATRSITIAATCSNGLETRKAIADATDNLQAAQSRYAREIAKIFKKAKFLTLRSEVLTQMKNYIDGLCFYASQYTAIEPIAGENDYRQQMRNSQRAKDNLLEFIAENDSRFVEDFDRLTDQPKDLDVKRKIKDLALRINPNPKEGEFAEVGQEVYKLIRGYRKPTIKNRRAIELFAEYISETGQILDKRGLGIFMSRIYDLA
jgi:hypothetical protein